MNSKTVEGYTPIVVAIMNRSNQALEILLKYGGIDIHVINIQKRTPYEVALNYKNDIAIRLLMSYESACKKKQYLNRKALKQGVVLESKERCCESFLDCLFNCFSFGMYSEDRKLNEDILRVSVLTGGSKE